MGTFKNIKSGKIQVLPALKCIKDGGDEVVFENGKCYQFDAIIFATGFRRSAHLWLQGNDCFLIKMEHQSQCIQIIGKERMGFIVLDLQEQDLLELPWMPKR
ncbi:hypothetical protein L1987_21840 [Smallanthus sonchifolius]|uniref:Uncharacterized protein n=1 Tax=Smallanthus sonchifolius TaxID=185202 RepID=A0ACB9IDR0_9ASTR|nr:hypothetical protein L1987_21840 [Smallanthus sonchifolius]